MALCKERLIEILRFCVVGGICFVIDYGLLYGFTEWAGVSYLLSAGISFSISVLVNYCLCVKYVFIGAGKQTKKRLAMFFLVSIIGLFINQLCMWLFVEFAKFHYMLAKVIATVFVIVWNYIMKKKSME